jgi:hypothetical protein
MNLQSLRMAGNNLPGFAQGLLESALVADLRAKHKMNFHLPQLVQNAKDALKEQGLPMTPRNLRQAAKTVASRQETLLNDTVGVSQHYWSPAAKDFVERTIPDPRRSFIR